MPPCPISITNRLRWSYLISSTLPLILVGTLLIVVLFQVQQRNAFARQQAIDRVDVARRELEARGLVA